MAQTSARCSELEPVEAGLLLYVNEGTVAEERSYLYIFIRQCVLLLF